MPVFSPNSQKGVEEKHYFPWLQDPQSCDLSFSVMLKPNQGSRITVEKGACVLLLEEMPVLREEGEVSVWGLTGSSGMFSSASRLFTQQRAQGPEEAGRQHERPQLQH